MMRVSVSVIIAAILAVAIFCSSFAVGYLSIKQMRTALNSEYDRAGDSNINSLLLLVETTYPGEWSHINGELYKGKSPVASWQETIDDLGQATGALFSIFSGPVRIATNVRQGGNLQLGTQVSDTVAQKVLGKGEEYKGTADVVGVPHFTTYIPIRDKSQQVIGIISSGIPVASLESAVAKTRNNVIMGGLGFFILAAVAAFVVTRLVIISPLHKLNTAVSKVAQGDLTVRTNINANKELNILGDNINQMTLSLHGLVDAVARLVTDLGAHSEELAAASEEVAASAQDMASTSAQVAASVAEGSASAVEVAATAGTMAKDASKGESAAQQALKMMDNVSHQSAATDTAMSSLMQQTQEIAVITEEIRNIAEQTNLLALNAAIEAARAGDHGRGFAVVADAVRQLAQQSSAATKEISSIIGGIVTGTKTANQAVSEVSSAISQAENTVTSASLALGDISRKVTELSSAIAEVASGSDQASQGAEQLAAAIQEVSSTSQEMAGAAQGLAQMAEKLQREIARFRI